MTNATSGFGLRVLSRKGGEPARVLPTKYEIPSTYANPVHPGTPVVKDTNGKCVPYTPASGTGVFGVVAQVFDANGLPLPDANASDKSFVGSVTRHCTIYDESNIFEIREDSDSSSVAQADINQNFELVAPSSNAGQEPPYVAGWLLDSDSAAGTDTLPVRVIAISETDLEDSNVIGTDSNKICQVIINSVQADS